MKTILLKFAGPMQSWGTDSHFETRHTDLYPAKSAVIGLIGAALGIRRDDAAIKELEKIKFATRIDQEGSLLKDYHIARKYKPGGDFDRTYVTERYYLEDAVFVVAISHEDDNLIEKIYEALKRPYFQMFLGRRSIPVFILLIYASYSFVTALPVTPYFSSSFKSGFSPLTNNKYFLSFILSSLQSFLLLTPLSSLKLCSTQL